MGFKVNIPFALCCLALVFAAGSFAVTYTVMDEHYEEEYYSTLYDGFHTPGYEIIDLYIQSYLPQLLDEGFCSECYRYEMFKDYGRYDAGWYRYEYACKGSHNSDEYFYDILLKTDSKYVTDFKLIKSSDVDNFWSDGLSTSDAG